MTEIKNKRLAIDLDGIITKENPPHEWKETTPEFYEGWYTRVAPNTENISKVNVLYTWNKIMIYTARTEDYREITESWLRDNKVKYDALIMGKLPYDFLIDDHAAHSFEDFERLIKC